MTGTADACQSAGFLVSERSDCLVEVLEPVPTERFGGDYAALREHVRTLIVDAEDEAPEDRLGRDARAPPSSCCGSRAVAGVERDLAVGLEAGERAPAQLVRDSPHRALESPRIRLRQMQSKTIAPAAGRPPSCAGRAALPRGALDLPRPARSR